LKTIGGGGGGGIAGARLFEDVWGFGGGMGLCKTGGEGLRPGIWEDSRCVGGGNGRGALKIGEGEEFGGGGGEL